MATARGSKPAKARRSNQQTTHRLQQALDGNKDLRGYGIKADVHDGEAILHGVVDTLSEQRHAGSVARNTHGVTSVDSAVSLGADEQIDDEDVEFEVAEELNADPDVDLKHIGVKSSHGAVTLARCVILSSYGRKTSAPLPP